MEKHAGKRERSEESDESRKPCEFEELEANPAKRVCKDSNVDVVSEITSEMDNEELGLGREEIEEEMVWDMMKMFEEIVSSPSCRDKDDASDELECSGSEGYTSNPELDYLFGASNEELGIPDSPSVHTVNDYNYNLYGFFECLEMEEVEQQLLLQFWLGYSESVEQEGSDLFSIHDCHLLSNQIDSTFHKG